MTVLMIIFGILLIACGVSFMFTPLLTFMDVGYFIVILVTVYGIIGLIKSISMRRYRVEFAFSIISIVFGLVTLFVPGMLQFTQGILLYLTAAWFVVQGIVSIISAVTVRARLWGLLLAFGILALLIGCYSFFHPAILAVSIGLLIGFYFIETGITMLLMSPKAE